MTSYQRLKERIEFHKQCIKELEEIAKLLAREIGKLTKGKARLPLIGSGITGDSFLTHYNNEMIDGGFRRELEEEIAKGRKG